MPEPEIKKQTLENLLGKAAFKDLPDFLRATHSKFAALLQAEDYDNLGLLVELADLRGPREILSTNHVLKSSEYTIDKTQLHKAQVHLIQNDKIRAFRKLREWIAFIPDKPKFLDEELQDTYNRLAQQGKHFEISEIARTTGIKPKMTEEEKLQRKYNKWTREGIMETVVGIHQQTGIKPRISSKSANQGYTAIMKMVDIDNNKYLQIAQLYAYTGIIPRTTQDRTEIALAAAILRQDFAFVQEAKQEFNWQLEDTDSSYILAAINGREYKRTINMIQGIYAVSKNKPSREAMNAIRKFYGLLGAESTYRKVRAVFSK